MKINGNEIQLDAGESVRVSAVKSVTPAPTPTPVPTDLGTFWFSAGGFSDCHFDKDDKHNSEYREDLLNALQYWLKNNVSFVFSEGDFVQYSDEDFELFYKAYGDFCKANYRLPLFAIPGNHDFLRMFHCRTKDDKYTDYGTLYKYIPLWQNVSSFLPSSDDYDIHFFEYGAKWDAPQYSGHRRTKSKLNFWFEFCGTIWVFTSVDYGTDRYTDPWDTLIRGINLIDFSDPYAKEMLKYVDMSDADRLHEANFDYQYYQPEVLIWLKDIIEGNKGRPVIWHNHLPLPNKAGDVQNDYKHLRIWPVPENDTIKKKYYSGSVLPTGITFHFLDKLLQENRNVIAFTGHTHYCAAQLNDRIKRQYNVKLPTGDEITPVVENLNSLDGTKYDYRLYSIEGRSIGDCAETIHVPSLSRPVDVSGEPLYGASEGLLCEFYEKGMIVKFVRFKAEGAKSYTNEIIKEITIPYIS